MRLTIDRLEDDRAVLRTDDSQEFTVPIREIPDGAGEGDVLNLRFHADHDATEDRTARAKDILNEILSDDH